MITTWCDLLAIAVSADHEEPPRTLPQGAVSDSIMIDQLEDTAVIKCVVAEHDFPLMIVRVDRGHKIWISKRCFEETGSCVVAPLEVPYRNGYSLKDNRVAPRNVQIKGEAVSAHRLQLRIRSQDK